MTKATTIPKRWRPRFSLRTLVLFVTLVGVYFGAWEATKTFGVPAVAEVVKSGSTEIGWHHIETNSPLPFCVRICHLRYNGCLVNEYRRDFLWIFGWVVHLKDEDQGWKQ